MRKWKVDLLGIMPAREGYKYGLTCVDIICISVQENIECIGQPFLNKRVSWKTTIKDHIHPCVTYDSRFRTEQNRKRTEVQITKHDDISIYSTTLLDTG